MSRCCCCFSAVAAFVPSSDIRLDVFFVCLYAIAAFVPSTDIRLDVFVLLSLLFLLQRSQDKHSLWRSSAMCDCTVTKLIM